MEQSKTTATFVHELAQLGIELSVAGDKLNCSAPKGVLTAQLRTELQERKAELMAYLGNGGGKEHAALPTLQRTVRPPTLPLAPAQRQLWVLNRLAPESAFYNVTAPLRLTGTLDVAAMEWSLNELVRRHEVLRTTFIEVDGVPAQRIRQADPVPLPVTDLQHLPAGERQAQALQQLQEAAGRPFDLENGPLVRMQLFRLAAQEHILLFSLHHIISDGWSAGVFVKEIVTLYTAHLRGEKAPLPELPVQYADYVLWQQQWLQSAACADHLAYWEKQLADAPLLQLYTDRPRPAMRAFRGATETFSLSPALTAAIKALSQAQGTTLFMTLLAAFQALLYRYTQQTDLVIGTRVAGRNRREVESMVGLFVNSLVLRADLSGQPTFRELLRRVRAMTMDAYTHQDVPFEMLVEKLQPPRDQNRNPFFQVMFVLQNFPTSEMSLQGLSMQSIEMPNDTARFDMDFTLTDAPGGLQAQIEYDTDLFEAETVRRLLRHYGQVLEQMAADPDRRLDAFELLSEAERHQILLEWNDTARPYEREVCLAALFEQQAASTPDEIAIIDDEHDTFTFRELNRRANQLAHALQALGVGPEVPVGVYVERSSATAWALLAILKAGGAYVPLDPSYPIEHLAYVIQDTQVPVIITWQRLADQLPPHRATLICLDTDKQLAHQPEGNPANGATPANLSHIMYTSGTTGRPKGIAVEQHQLINRLAWRKRAHPFQAGEVACQRTTASFSVSLAEQLEPLTQGVPSVIIADHIVKDARRLIDTLARHRVTRIVLFPSLLRMLLDEDENLAERLPHLKLWVVFGEKLAPELYLRFCKQMPHAVFFQQFGASELNDTCCNDTRQPWGDYGCVPIGRPIDNMRVYILDARMQPTPAGVPGEIYVSGDGMARGYHGRPELTAERFVPDPFSGVPGGRLYRMGDLARWLPDGQVEYIGRRDHQIKIHGIRIELEGIDNLLNRHPAVSQAVAMIRTDVPGFGDGDGAAEPRLVAYVVPRAGSALTVSELRQFLQPHMHEAMIPSAYVFLDALPRLPNGKVNRRELPAPDQSRPALATDFVEPRTPLEAELAAIWCSLLKVEQVGVKDNFFELGGHSLLATQVISQVRHAFQADLPLRTFFEAPTIDAVARHIEASRSAETAAPALPLLPATRTGPLPLSFAQQRLWFLDQLLPNSAAYNIPVAVRLTGALAPAILAQSLNSLVQRHEILRTTFALDGDQPVQVISPTLVLELPIEELDELAPEAQEAAVRQTAQAEAALPFDLARGPLIRARLLRLAETDYVLLLTVHHIIFDGWSTGVLIREVARIYQALTSGAGIELPPLPVQYADYAIWQRQWLQGDVLEEQLGYWKEQLAGAPELELPTDYPRPETPRLRGAQCAWHLENDLAEALKAFSQQAGVTLFMTLFAAFQVVLYRYTRQTDLVIGSRIAGRNQKETEDLIGFFINAFVLRTDLSGSPTFRELLERVRTVTVDAYAHQDLPFEMLVEALQPQRDLNRQPFFQIMFVLLNFPTAALALPGIQAQQFMLANDTAKLDLDFSINETETGLDGHVTYNADLFKVESIRRLLQHYTQVLKGILANPDQKLSALPLLPDAEQQQLLVDWNDTQHAYPEAGSLAQLFEQQVARTPLASAITDENETLTYQELNRRANRLAHALQSRGVGPDVAVGVSLERSCATLVALLAIYKAGGVYVPVDPAYPPEYSAYVLNDTQVSVLITRQGLAAQLPPHSAALICLDDDTHLSGQPESNPTNRATPEHLSHIMYTSGSTGLPKGVAVPQRQLRNRLAALWQAYPYTPGEVAAQRTTINFSPSLTEFLGPVLQGALLAIIPDEVVKDAPRFIAALAERRVTRLVLVPSLLRTLLDSAESLAGRLPALKLCIVCGEKVPYELCQRFQAQLPHTVLCNDYGSTETHGITWCDRRQLADDWSYLPVGRPIANVQVYVLDPDGQPAPIGVPGEVYVGGAGLARGYLNQPDLTAAKFVPHPFSRESGARLYRTGDLARFRADGQLEYLGRCDHQVKLHGIRIELEGVEAWLNEHPAVYQAAARLDTDEETQSQRLVAYIVPHVGQQPTAGELRKHLQAHLPSAVLPQAFVFLAALPLLPNGKIDRRALPAPSLDRADLANAFVAPRTPTEELLAGIWQQLLKVAQVGVEDSFFELGGHSLSATQVISHVRSLFQVEVSLLRFFEKPTVVGLAAQVEELQAQERATSAAPLQPLAHDGQIPLSFAQQRLWFLEQLMPGNVAYNIPVAVRFTGELNEAALEASLQALVRRHAALRTTFILDAAQPRQRIAPDLILPVDRIDLRSWPVETRQAEAQRLAQAAATQPFDLACGPLLRAMLLRLGDDEYLLVLIMHHIISDGWSMGLVVREVAAVYQAYVDGSAPALLPLPVQYADYAVWQRQWLQGEVLEQQMRYWKQQLADAPMLELPTDRPRPTVQSVHGAQQTCLVSHTLTDALKTLSRQAGTTLFMTLLAAFQVLLYRYTDQDDVVLGSRIAGRNRRETEGLIGFFVNTLVLRTDLSGNPTFRALLERVRLVTLDAYAHQDLPFEMVVEALQPQRDLSRHPFFQVMFALLNFPLKNLELPGVAANPLVLDNGTAKFDLDFSWSETADGLLGQVEYNTDLFDAGSIQRLLAHYHRILEAIVADLDTPLDAITLFDAAERRQVLVDWNETRQDYPEARSLPMLFERQAARTPDAVALVYETEVLTYQALNERANQLAHALCKMGVGPETLVGVCAERSPEMVVALLGILKAGGAYVPLDPTYPAERLAYLAADMAQAMNGKPPVILTQGAGAAHWPASGQRILRLDADWEQIANEPRSNPGSAVSGENLAYVIYTSGSTGQPKGAMNRHSAICNRLQWMQAAYRLADDDCVLQKTPFTFDVSVWEFFWPLLAGARLVLAKPEGHKDGAYLAQLIAEQRVTTLHFVPSMLRLFLEEPGLEERCRSLRRVICSGEALSTDLQARSFARLPAALYNLYGPTEAAVDVTHWTCERQDSRASVPIGRPIANTQLYILDRQMRPVPVGVPGELYIGGDNLGRGYLARPDLTAERFVPNPFAALLSETPTANNTRLYKTGDRARYAADGTIEFLGRLDFQVKIRGFRIETGEIEAVLAQHPRLQTAVVVARETAPGEKQLVAYVVPQPGADAGTVSDWRDFLATRLPDYMLPANFVPLEALPLTASGKIDRRALPAPSVERPMLSATFVAPGTALEKQLAEIWAQALQLKEVGVHDNFFELGGHSLLLAQIQHRLQAVFPDRQCSMVDLFRYPTISALSRYLEQASDENAPLRQGQERVRQRMAAQQRRARPLSRATAQAFEEEDE
ncbi:MAG: amino acid adenylation domain-containing protein [Chloroflexota bacterium]